MFLTELTEPQQLAFHNIAIGLIYSDDILDINEAQLMTKLDSEMGLLKKGIPNNIDLEDSLKAFDSKKSKAILILELLNIAYSDSNFNIDESEYIQRIADSLEIKSIEFTEMKWWAGKKANLDKEVLRFF